MVAQLTAAAAGQSSSDDVQLTDSVHSLLAELDGHLKKHTAAASNNNGVSRFDVL